MAKVWKHRLFSECCDSPCNCCYGTCLGPCAAASAKSQFDGSSWLYNIWWLCSPLPMTGLWNYAVLRNYIRQGYEIDGDASDDCLTSTFCSPCVITQLLNEVSDRGPGVAPDADFIAKGNALNQVYAPNTHTDILMTYVCGYCEVASTYADAAGVVSCSVL
jgi:Cys-rich protein (TIGR01571 family)